MSAYLELLSKAQALPKRLLRNTEVLGILSDALGCVLALEGPPPVPLDGHFEWHIIRTRPNSGKTGSPRFAAATWKTGDWTCLLLVKKSSVLERGREIVLGDGTSRHTPTSSASQTAMRHLQYALIHFGFDQINTPCAWCSFFGKHRTFLAWRPLEPWEQADMSLRGDTDNYFKLVLDAAQGKGVKIPGGAHRLLRDDRYAARLVGGKLLHEGWERPMDDLLSTLVLDEIQTFAKKTPHPAKIREALGVTYAEIAQVLPSAAKLAARAKPKKGAKKAGEPQSEDTTHLHAAAMEGVRLLDDGTAKTPTQAAVMAQTSPREIRKLLVPRARKALVEEHTSLKEAAKLAYLTPPGLKHALRNDAEAVAAIQKLRSNQTERLAEMGRQRKGTAKAKEAKGPKATTRSPGPRPKK